MSSELVLRVAGTPVVQAEEGDAASYNVDNVKGRVGLDVEWHAKDGNLDRDIAAYRSFYDAGIIDCGVTVTMTRESLREWALGIDPETKKFMTSTTTNLTKVRPKLGGGGGGGDGGGGGEETGEGGGGWEGEREGGEEGRGGGGGEGGGERGGGEGGRGEGERGRGGRGGRGGRRESGGGGRGGEERGGRGRGGGGGGGEGARGGEERGGGGGTRGRRRVPHPHCEHLPENDLTVTGRSVGGVLVSPGRDGRLVAPYVPAGLWVAGE